MMKTSYMILLSLILNVVVLVPVCYGLMSKAAWVQDAYGASSPARSILTSVYLAILLVSIFLLWRADPKLVAALLLVQVIYKFTTPFTVGTLGNPVVVSNLFIGVVHCFTLFSIWRTFNT